MALDRDEARPEILRRLGGEELARFVPVSEEQLERAQAEGAREAEAARRSMHAVLPNPWTRYRSG